MLRNAIMLMALGTLGGGVAIAQVTPTAQGIATARSAEAPPAATTVVTPVTPPATVVTPTSPNTTVVTTIPGLAIAAAARIRNFGDYDLNGDGAYSPMEFAQALAFLANVTTGAGAADLPATDKFTHKGMTRKMQPRQATVILNATADEFAVVDGNNDWRITPDELAAAALM